jgi:uncharacterized protein (TIGR02271 family)
MSEIIAAVFDTVTHAETAMHDLESKGIARANMQISDAESHASFSNTEPTAQEETHPKGFFAWLFGDETADYHEDDRSYYREHVQAGRSILRVIVLSEAEAERVMTLLESHDPTAVRAENETSAHPSTAGIDPVVSRSGVAPETTTASTSPIAGHTADYVEGRRSADYVETPQPLSGRTEDHLVGRDHVTEGRSADYVEPATPISGRTEDRLVERDTNVTPGTRATEEVIPLAEEQLTVGKRTVDRGTTRIRRYVIEKPVTETVNLRDEKVTIERRVPVGNRTPEGTAFVEKTVEVRETTEEPVVDKVARVAEEVVINKTATERTETVEGTVRKEEIEVEGDHANRIHRPSDPAV